MLINYTNYASTQLIITNEKLMEKPIVHAQVLTQNRYTMFKCTT